jgi:flagellar hook assembly protein FlgD
VRIGLYNTAGELVKVITSDVTTNLITVVQTYAQGVTDPATVTDNTPLVIYLPGVETPDTQGNGVGTSFTWIANNAQSQNVVQGNYYIKIEQTDTYGHVTSYIKEVTVLRQEKYVMLNIFNEAGELVRTIKKENTGTLTGKLDLVVGDGKGTLAIDGNGSPVNVKYGANLLEYITWDGKDSQGNVVQSGSYEVQMVMQTDSGLTVEATQSIIVLREAKKYLDQLIIAPNPYDAKKGPAFVTFKWTFTGGVAQAGDMHLRVYNVAGELVAEMSGDLADNVAGITWDLKKEGKTHLARGIYICVLEAKNTAGYLDRAITKMAIAVYK